MTDARSMTVEEWKSLMEDMGEKSFRAGQIFSFIHQKGAVSYEEMTNLPKSLIAKLEETRPLESCVPVACQVSALDGTRKYLFQYPDGNQVESVLMKYHHGYSVCVSSQVGCRMGCRFCASTVDGLVRDLTAGEILSQIYEIGKSEGIRISNVVVMGSGEPLDNYDNVVRFIRLLTAKEGLDLSVRSITLSTCGLVPMIRKLKDEHLPVNLALSLHAPNDALRKTIMPVANKYPLSDIMDAMREYYGDNHRRITFEYSLISGVNDTDERAEELSRLLSGLNCLVNLIYINPVRERSFRAPKESRAVIFKKKLEKNGIHVTIRREMGRDIDGACGQLRRRYQEKKSSL